MEYGIRNSVDLFVYVPGLKLNPAGKSKIESCNFLAINGKSQSIPLIISLLFCKVQMRFWYLGIFSVYKSLSLEIIILSYSRF